MPEDEAARRMISRSERLNTGKDLRRQAPRGSHGDWSPAVDRSDPISLLQAQDVSRVQELVPIKYGRMLASPFAFLRGSAAVMAADLASSPATGIEAVLCGDAHLSNFGLFASPERRLIFDINDFDETFPGPWEWDLKRLAASAVVAGRENDFSEKKCRSLAFDIARTYAFAMGKFSEMHTLDVWYYHVDADSVLVVFEKTSKQGKKRAKKLVSKARSKTHQQTLQKLTRMENGKRRIINDPPLLIPLRDLRDKIKLSDAELRAMTEQVVESAWKQYLDSLPDERRFLLMRYQIVDAALRVGGVGSVGTRVSIVLLEGSHADDALILQLKEAGASVLEPYGAKRHYENHAERVVTGQRLMQATNDIFLGWHSSDLTDRDYYWRQLKDMKGSAEVSAMDYDSFRTYTGICAWCLAHAHARTGDEASIFGYIGKNDSFSEAIGDFAVAYADQTERDYQLLVEAVKSGRVAAETGV